MLVHSDSGLGVEVGDIVEIEGEPHAIQALPKPGNRMPVADMEGKVTRVFPAEVGLQWYHPALESFHITSIP